MPLTKRQREILNYLTTYAEQNGFAPSFEEIAENFSYNSLATVHEHLTNLEGNETFCVPETMIGRGGSHYVLRVRGNSMVDEQIRDGDFVVVNERQRAD